MNNTFKSTDNHSSSQSFLQVSEEVKQNVRTVLKQHLPYCNDVLTLETKSNLRELGLNSMQAVDLVLNLEDTFDMIFDEDLLNAETFATYGSLCTTVYHMLNTD